MQSKLALLTHTYLSGLAAKTSVSSLRGLRSKSQPSQIKDLQTGTTVATPSEACNYRVGAWPGWPGISILWLHDTASLSLSQYCIIIIIIIAFKGAIRDFLQSPHSAANCLQHARSSGPGAIVCKSCATHQALIMCNMSCYVPLGTKGQLSY